MRWTTLCRRNCPTSSVTASPCHLPLIGEGISAAASSPLRRSAPAPLDKGSLGCVQNKKISPQKGADQQIWSAPSIDSRYSTATSCKFDTPVSGGAYQDAREVTIVWNDA